MILHLVAFKAKFAAASRASLGTYDPAVAVSLENSFGTDCAQQIPTLETDCCDGTLDVIRNFASVTRTSFHQFACFLVDAPIPMLTLNRAIAGALAPRALFLRWRFAAHPTTMNHVVSAVMLQYRSPLRWTER